MIEVIDINGKLGVILPDNVISDLNLTVGDTIHLNQVDNKKYELKLPEYTKSNWFRAVDLADYIVWKCNMDNHLVNNFKLQKIIAKIYQHFKNKHNMLIFSDDVEVWKIGLVVPEVYYKYSSFGATDILIIDMDMEPKLVQILSANLISEIDKIIDENRSKPIWLL